MKKAVMYGAGNIGRGFIGQLFSQSGYEVAFIDINPVIIERLNEDKAYPIRIAARDRYEEITVSNVRGVNGFNIQDVAEEIATADIMATAIGVNALPKISKPIALGLKKRWEKKNFNPLNIIICENLIDANKYMEKLIKAELNEEEIKLFDEYVGLVEASIGRMVPIMTEEMQEGNPLRVYVEEYCELPVDKDGFKGEIPAIKNMIPYSPFDLYIQRKLFMHNMGHATCAYLGFLKNHTYIWETMENVAIKLITLRALLESAIALSVEHNYPLHKLIEHADDLIYRFSNKLLGDTVARVGKDPVRKLAANDRLVGATRLCLKHGISPSYICLGIAAGYAFSPEGDESAAKVVETVQNEGIESALSKFSGINKEKDEVIFNMIVDFYDMIRRGKSPEELEQAAEIKSKIITE
ncbi:MAG TPA: mannitol dehydrogenase [Clostridiaceae bacterium]|jgi:mannitol-1-phosphate 5-dehydrogenase|nr:mannitol dehydrogenase [Clostridiaceae bacterium]